MKVVILAGGYGTRLSEETLLRPKPMVEIGEKPILWHIMKCFSFYGFNDFIILCGYKGHVIKDFFINYAYLSSDITVDIARNEVEFHDVKSPPWKVTLIETGLNTMTGGRIRYAKDYVGESDFFLTYGDGLANIDFSKLVSFHRAHGKLATVTAVTPPGRFGALDLDGDSVRRFVEKPLGDGGYINGGFFILNPEIFKLLTSDKDVWEREPVSSLAESRQLVAFKHRGFFQPMDTARDKELLENLWRDGNAPWKIWID